MGCNDQAWAVFRCSLLSPLLLGEVPEAERERPESFDLVITDVRLTGETGDVLIERVGNVPVIVMTAYGSVDAAVDAIVAEHGRLDVVVNNTDRKLGHEPNQVRGSGTLFSGHAFPSC